MLPPIVFSVNTVLNGSIYSPEWAFNSKYPPKPKTQFLVAFLKAMELTEQTRTDHFVRVKNIRPLKVGALETPRNCILLDYDGDIDKSGKSNKTYSFCLDQSCLIQLAQISDPPLPVAWFKKSFDGNTMNIVAPNGGVSSIQVDLRQQILRHIFLSRPRVERYFREEVPLIQYVTVDDTAIPRVTPPENIVRRVMGIVGKSYPREWSTANMFKSLIHEIGDIFDELKYDLPYVTEAGTYTFRFHSEDSEHIIEPKVGDVLGIGGVLKDNPYGRAAFSWTPRTLRLSCLNGMTTHRVEGYIYIRHTTFNSMVQSLVEDILAPRMNEDLEFISKFEANLPEPMDVSHYTENRQDLYDHLARVMVARMLGSVKDIRSAYKHAASLVIEDYKADLEYVCTKYDVGKQVLERLLTIPAEDNTIPNPENEDFTVYDMSNVFTAYANFPISEEQRQRYSEIGGEIIMNPRLIAVSSG